MTDAPSEDISFFNEVRRKAFHFSTAVIPVGYYLTDYPTALWTIGGILGLAIVIEYARMAWVSFNERFMHFFGTMLRDSELRNYSGATYLLMSAFLVILFFYKDVAILSLLFLIFGDGVAAIIGKRFGKRALFYKSVEGTVACLAVCLVVGIFFGHLPLAVRIAGAVVATLAEVLPFRASDNLRIPILSGSIMQILLISFYHTPIVLDGREVII